MGLLDALQDKGFRNDVADGLRNALNRGLLGGVLGAPVDLATMALRPLGYKVQQPVMGSDWIGQKLQDAGMVSNKRNHLAEMMAGLLDPATMATGAVKAAAAVPMVAGMFIGKGAKTWDALQASKAMELEKSGAPARQIWSETGTWKGPDGMWRQEIPDNMAKPGNKYYSWGEGKDLEQGNFTVVRRQKALLHPKLSAAYPDTKEVSVFLRPYGSGGMYEPELKQITAATNKNGPANSSTMMHELQHHVQEREGFAKGGSPEEFYASSGTISGNVLHPDAQRIFENALKDGGRPTQEGAAFEAYRRLAGEAEARATQARIPMDATQRRSTFPEDSYDVPINQLIVRQDGLLGPQLSTVWHGSPHQFNKFDASKIGTGEGAQAYGHGLYLAESPEVAKGYQAANMGRARAGDGFLDSLPPGVQVDAYNLLQSKVRGPIGDARLEALRTTLKPNQFEKLEAAYRGGDSSLYKVDLPDDQIAKMLDWDKPLSESQMISLYDKMQQTELNAFAKPFQDNFYDRMNRGHPATDGQDLFMELSKELGGQKYVSDALRKMDIPGIRYLDGGSRGTGGGTSNFVVFPGNEDMLTILERNGQPVNALRGLLER